MPMPLKGLESMLKSMTQFTDDDSVYDVTSQLRAGRKPVVENFLLALRVPVKGDSDAR